MGLDWKKAFKVEPADVLGMDIGSAQIKLVELRREASGYALSAAGIAKIAGSAEEQDQAEMNTTEAIGACLRSAQPHSRLAVCGVCGPEVAVRGFKFPALPRDEIEGAVLLEAAQVCPFNIEEGAVDYQLMGNGDDSVRGVLVAATRKVIKAKTRVAGGADLECVLVDVDGLALLNCFAQVECEAERPAEGRRTTAILNVGSTYTTLAIGGSDGLPFVRDIVYGISLSRLRIEPAYPKRRPLASCSEAKAARPSRTCVRVCGRRARSWQRTLRIHCGTTTLKKSKAGRRRSMFVAAFPWRKVLWRR
jgi:type IV pilus assembly protein PilM